MIVLVPRLLMFVGGQTWPLFVLFSSFSQYNDKYNTKLKSKYKKHKWCAWDSNPGICIVSADESTGRPNGIKYLTALSV